MFTFNKSILSIFIELHTLGEVTLYVVKLTRRRHQKQSVRMEILIGPFTSELKSAGLSWALISRFKLQEMLHAV